ncbi:hypothetical protein V8C26DRAFT_410867 [Trichoderma gracile]
MSCTEVLNSFCWRVPCQTRYTSHLVDFEIIPSCEARSTTAMIFWRRTETGGRRSTSTLQDWGILSRRHLSRLRTPVARCHLVPWLCTR